MENAGIVTDSPQNYRLAGWLAIVSSILLLPEIILGLVFEFLAPDFKIIVAVIHFFNTIIAIYIWYMFKILLNKQFDFHQVNIPIMIIIGINILFFFLGIVDLYGTLFETGEAFKTALGIVTFSFFVPFCIVNIIFAVILLKIKDDLFGLLKPFAYLTIISGALGATIILAPLGLITVVISLVIQGMIFLRAQGEIEIL